MPQPPVADVLHFLRKSLAANAACDTTDDELLERFVQERDEAAVTNLVQRHGPLVLGVCRRILGDGHDAEDAFQATFIVLVRRAGSIRRRERLGGWLHGVAQRIAYKARAQAAGRRQRERQHAPMPCKDMLDELTWRELRTVLDEEIARLPDKYRTPLVLCYLEGKNYQQAAKELGLAKSSLGNRIARGRELLRQQLVRRGITLSAGVLATVLGDKVAGAALPALLTINTVKTATLVVAGKVAAVGCVSARAIAMAEEAVAAMVGFKGKLLVMVLVLGLGIGGAGWAGYSAPVEKPQEPPAAKAQPPAAKEQWGTNTNKNVPVALDQYGDALPPGAVNRIGSNRLRPGGIGLRVLYTPDGKALASTSLEGRLNLWDAVTGKLRWRLAVDKDGIFQGALAVGADGKTFVALSNLEYAVVACDTGKKLVRHEWPKANKGESVRCSAIAPDLGSFARGYFDATVRLYDAVTGQEKMSIIVGEKAQNQAPIAVEFSADGKTIYVVANEKPGIMVFDTKTGKGGQTLEVSKALTYPCWLVSSHKHHFLAAMDPDRAILWDLTAGKERQVLKKEQFPVWSGAFSPDDSLFAAGWADIVLFETATGKERRRLRSSPGTRSLTFAPDGKTLAAAGDAGSITLWDLESGKAIPPVPESFWELGFASKGKQIVTLGDNIDWWDATSAKLIRSWPLGRMKFRPSVSLDGKLLTEILPPGDLGIVDTTTSKSVKALTGFKAAGWYTRFSPDGTKLFSAGGYFDSRVIIWDVARGKPLHELKNHAGLVNGLAVSPNGRWLASAATGYTPSRDYDIRLWDVSTGKLVRRLTPRRGCAFSMVFSADSTRLVSVGGEPNGPNTSGEVQLWDLDTGKEMHAFIGHQEVVNCITMTADGRMLASGSRDKTLRLWEVATGAERGRIEGHEAEVYSVDFSPDGRLLAAASFDAPIYLWNPYAVKNPISTGTKLTKQDREKLWDKLADTDATKGFQAVCELIARPSEAVAILEGGWKQLPRAAPEQMRKWIDDLSSDQFAVRKTATAELERFAAAHEDLLNDALKQARSLEARQRLENLVGRLDPERLRRTRMLEVLEQLRTPSARRFLQALAGQKEDTLTAREAEAGLKRLEQQK